MAAGADYFPSLRRIASQPSGGGAPASIISTATEAGPLIVPRDCHSITVSPGRWP